MSSVNMDFKKLADYFQRIETASSRLEMTDHLAELFAEAKADEIGKIIYLSQGELSAAYVGLESGMGESLIAEGIAKANGYSKEDVEKQYKELGDLGLVAEKLAGNKKQQALFSSKLDVEKVFANFYKIATVEGGGSQQLKIKLFAELLNSASPVEAKFIARIPEGNMRLGIGDPTIMDAFAINLSDELRKDKKIIAELESGLKEKKEEKRKEELDRKIKFRVRAMIEEKYNIHSDLGEIARILKETGLAGLEKVEITSGIPIRPTLAERLESAEKIVEKIGKCLVEAKYDGFRFQIHKKGNEVTIFSRQSENMTHMFPEIVEGAKRQINAKSAIIEGEALALDEQTGQYFPFQVTIQRKRKYDIGAKAKEFPLRLFVFDVMMVDGKNMMDEPFEKRRAALKKLIKKGDVIELTDGIVSDNPKEIDEYFETSIEKGLEGIIAKDLKAKYIAGARKFAWIKLKRSYKGELSDSVDVVIIGYFKGRGKRVQFGLGGLLTAVYDEEEDKFKSIAKVGTGMSEDKMVELEKMLGKISSAKKPARVDSGIEPDIWVEPKYVIEVRADEITRSPNHTAGKEDGDGYALRFPRLISDRTKKPEEATSVKEIQDMYRLQKHVQIDD
ncbi:MAG: ATP-dependent DNA ligase [Candidatus Diapherotrites archaeon]